MFQSMENTGWIFGHFFHVSLIKESVLSNIIHALSLSVAVFIGLRMQSLNYSLNSIFRIE